MKLIVMGQQAFGKAALEKILTDGIDEVVAVYCAPDKVGKPFDPLKQYAIEQNIPVYQPANFSDDATLNQLDNHQADLMVMAYVIIFVPEKARDIPKLGSICFHPSLLPLHRGPSSINWSIIFGEKETGFSWFYPTDGLDEGDILLQWKCPIEPDDTLGDVYFKKIFPAAIDSVSTVCKMFRTGNTPRIVQNEANATYESWCRAKDAEIDWNQPVQKVYNLIRGTNPQPGAWSTYKGKTIKIFDARLIHNAGKDIGLVKKIDDDGLVINAKGGGILVKRVRLEGQAKIPVQEWIETAVVKVGDQFGGN